MAMDATLQIRMDKEIKSQVEALYRGMGTSFAEAVRIFAQQSLREGGMPFRPTLKNWDELSQQDIDKKLAASIDEAASGQVYTQAQLDEIMTERFRHG